MWKFLKQYEIKASTVGNKKANENLYTNSLINFSAGEKPNDELPLDCDYMSVFGYWLRFSLRNVIQPRICMEFYIK